MHFESEVYEIGATTLLSLPASASEQLPSRGMVLVEGSIDGEGFKFPLEPDGEGGHWLDIGKALGSKAAVKPGDKVEVEIGSSKDWPEPRLPADLRSALKADKKAGVIWDDITPMARWDWLRWIASTGNTETRKRRVAVALSKLKGGTRRPCCFNRALCTVPAVSKNGLLLKPAAKN